MEEKYTHFDEKRMRIFNELVKRYWNGALNSKEDLEELAREIKEKYGFDDSETPFIINHIRMAMGLDPAEEIAFQDELNAVQRMEAVVQPVVCKLEGLCEHCNKQHCACRDVKKYESPIYRRNEEAMDSLDESIRCGYTTSICDYGAIADKIEFLPLVKLLKDKETPVFATVAPAIVGQFGDDVSMGQLRTALKMMGFEDMIEVALFADLLTIKEAFEFNQLVKTEEDFFLTSCCCPMWFNMIKKSYPEVYEHLSPSVSPMIASARILKELYEDAKIVFLAPCVAKKGEIKDPDLSGAVDYVLSFRELREIFDALQINLSELTDDDKDQASLGGRLYARTGGVSFSVKTVVNRLEPSRVIKLKAEKVNGIKECKTLLDNLSAGKKGKANFIEGMGCTGGCVGGPRTNIEAEKATKHVNDFGEESYILTPFDNQNIMKILEQFGLNAFHEIMEDETIKRILSRE